MPKIFVTTSFSTLFFAAFIFIAAPNFADAHQPRVVQGELVEVVDPEISKAYYGTLTGAPHIYIIDASAAFNLYVSILVPDIASADKTMMAEVFKGEKQIATIGGSGAPWKKFFEPFGQSSYLDGGEHKTRADAGVYTIKVKSQSNSGKYSLAVGEIEVFDRTEGMSALAIIPELKKDFFEESPISFIKSPFGWGLIVVMYVLAGIFGFMYRAFMKRFAGSSRRGATRNIGTGDRLLRLALGVGLLLWAITTSWSPILIFFSGFMMFEAVFGWCGLYAMVGRDSCEVKKVY